MSGAPIGGSDGAVLWQGIAAAGTSQPFDLVGLGTLFVASIVTSVNAAGTLQVFLDVSDVAGNFQQQIALTAQTVAGVQTGVLPVPSTVQPTLVGRGRFRWTSTGSFNVALVAVGK
jgi:hypothetical protein